MRGAKACLAYRYIYRKCMKKKDRSSVYIYKEDSP